MLDGSHMFYQVYSTRRDDRTLAGTSCSDDMVFESWNFRLAEVVIDALRVSQIARESLESQGAKLMCY